MRGMPGIIVRGEGQVFSLHYLKTTQLSIIRLHEKVNNYEMICHNQNYGSLPKVRVTQKSKTK